jgi:hypothetical protein
MALPFQEQLILTVVDKMLIAGVLLLAGWGLNRLLEKLKSELAIKNEFAKLRDAKQLEFLEKQLSQFYYPLYIRLHIDGAVWTRILDKQNGNDELRQKVGAAIERNIILPNHEAMVKIIEGNIHLAESDALAFNQMLSYVRHVAVYRAMRESGCQDKDPISLGEPWPSKLLPIIEATTYKLQTDYDRLLVDYLKNVRPAEKGKP